MSLRHPVQKEITESQSKSQSELRDLKREIHIFGKKHIRVCVCKRDVYVYEKRPTYSPQRIWGGYD